MVISRKAVYYVCFVSLISFVLVSKTQVAPAYGYDSSGINPQQVTFVTVADLADTFKGDWQKAFVFVRNNIRFEPTPHLMKTARGVLWGGSGNAKEQALLLTEVLRQLNIETRMASGRLDPDGARVLIGTLFPEKKNFSHASDIPLSQPLENEALITRVSDHVWVQIKQSGQWIDLDPCFPGAKAGASFADAQRTITSFPKRAFPRMKIKMHVQKGGRPKTILTLEKNLHEMVNQPISLSISTRFEETEASSSGGSVGGMFGAMAGGTSSKKAKKGLVANYTATLFVKKGMTATGKFTEKVPGKSQQLAAKDILDRLWLTFRLTHEGGTLFESERVLFEKSKAEDELPLFQRHAILIAPNVIPLKAWEKDLAKVTDDRLLKQIKSSVDQIKKSVKSEKDKTVLLNESLSLEEKLGRNMGHLINMVFAYASDNITADAAEALSVRTCYALPRIIICSVAGDGKAVKTVMDLRKDSVEVIPYPGQALGMIGTFLYGRGVFESVLEGKVLELFLGKRSLTTAYIMQEASRKKIPVRFLSQNETAQLKRLGMPKPMAARALKALEAGAVIVIPEQGIRFHGRKRWGWWQVDPKTKEVVGVLDTGLHQAMIQRTILDTEGMVNPKMAYTIGAITGAVDTQWMLASMILKYGELDKAALEEIKAYMKQLKTYMCPGFDASVSETIASVGFEIEDCYEYGYSLDFEAGVKIEMGWCQAFVKGFACASTSILNYYLSQYE